MHDQENAVKTAGESWSKSRVPWTDWPEWAKKIKPKFTAGDHVYLCPHKYKPIKLRGRIVNVQRHGAYGQTIFYDTDIPWGDQPNGVGSLSAHWFEPVTAVELLGEVCNEM